MNKCLIIGNGKSRKEYDLNKFKDYTSFGCNALYREFEPDYLFVIDEGMEHELIKNNVPFVKIKEDEKWEPEWSNKHRPRNNAGMLAMQHAIDMGYEELNCIGFDFLIDDSEKRTSNIFEGSENYDERTKCSFQDTFGRRSYLLKMMSLYDNVQFNYFFPEKEEIDLMKLESFYPNFKVIFSRDI